MANIRYDSSGSPVINSGTDYLAYQAEMDQLRINKINAIDDIITKDRIEQLHPQIKNDTIDFILDLQKMFPDMTIRISSGYRTFEEQDALYQQGRTTEGNIVTNGKAGEGYHNYGMAIDIAIIENGKAIWDHPEYYEQMAEICEEYNFEWGGNWEKFPDYPHFQNTFGFSTSELKNMLQCDSVDLNGYVIVKGD